MTDSTENCEWLIEVENGHSIEITMTAFQVAFELLTVFAVQIFQKYASLHYKKNIKRNCLYILL